MDRASRSPAPEQAPSLGERIAFARVPLWLLVLVMLGGLVVAIWGASLARQPYPKKRSARIAVALAQIPDTLKQMKRNRSALVQFRPMYDGSYEHLPDGLWRNPAAAFTDPGYVLLTAFDDAHNRAEVHLLRLSDGKLLHRYVPDNADINARSHFKSALIDLKRDKDQAHNLMMHPLLMPDGGLVIHDTTPLTKIDACGKVQWSIDGIFHHSLEPGPDGDLWAAYRYPRSPMPEVSEKFNDEAVAQVSTDGRLLQLIRVADILDHNGLGYLWRNRPYTDDPFHLNDVQPVFVSGPHWQRGDLLLSLRNLSMLMLYRPSTGKVLWWKIAPWSAQHDVEILDDHRISVFDNHWRFAAPEGEVDGGNRLLVYDFDSGEVNEPLAGAFAREHVLTRAQGRATPLPGGDFMIEETEPGRLMRLAADGTLRWRYISADSRMERFQLRWSRYLDPRQNQKAIEAAESAKCE
jgi:hypothetical protein